jgi:hypothetical protein
VKQMSRGGEVVCRYAYLTAGESFEKLTVLSARAMARRASAKLLRVKWLL